MSCRRWPTRRPLPISSKRVSSRSCVRRAVASPQLRAPLDQNLKQIIGRERRELVHGLNRPPLPLLGCRFGSECFLDPPPHLLRSDDVLASHRVETRLKEDRSAARALLRPTPRSGPNRTAVSCDLSPSSSAHDTSTRRVGQSQRSVARSAGRAAVRRRFRRSGRCGCRGGCRRSSSARSRT